MFNFDQSKILLFSTKLNFSCAAQCEKRQLKKNLYFNLSLSDFWIKNLPAKLKNEIVSSATMAKLPEAIGENWKLFVIADLKIEVNLTTR